MKKIFVLALALLCLLAFVSCSDEPQSDALSYTTEGETLTVSACGTNNVGAITIPSSVNGKTVTKIGANVFRDHTEIISVTLPETIVEIEGGAFSGCTSLKTINFPTSLAKIGASSFLDCSELTSVSLTVSKVPAYAFAGCSSLQKVSVGNATEIGAGAFLDCTHLVQISLGAPTIGANAFQNCVQLVEVLGSTLPLEAGANTYGSIARYAKNIGTTSKLTFSDNAYVYNNELIVSYVGQSASLTVNKNIGDYAFYQSNVQEVTVNAQSVGAHAFDSSKITAVTLNGVTSLGESAFVSCRALTSVQTGESLTVLPKYAFYNCSALQTVSLSSSIAKVGLHAFGNCIALEYNALDGNQYLGNAQNPYLVLMKTEDTVIAISVKDGTKVIYGEAIFNKQNLDNVTIPKSVLYVGGGALTQCPSLTKVNFSGNESDWANVVFENETVKEGLGNKVKTVK